MGIVLSELKNDLLFINEQTLDFTHKRLENIIQTIENKKWDHSDPLIHKLMLAIYFDTIDAFVRTSRYNKKGEIGLFYEDLKSSIENIFWALKPGGKLAIIIGDSTVNGKKIPTTMTAKKFCEETGFKVEKLIFNPLLGARNRAIRGESVIICYKPEEA